MKPSKIFDIRFQIAVAARYHAERTNSSLRDVYRHIAHAYRYDVVQPFTGVEMFEDFQCRHLQQIRDGVEHLKELREQDEDKIHVDGLVFGIDFAGHSRRQERNEKKEFIGRCLQSCEEQVKKRPLDAESIRWRFANTIYNACREYRSGAKKEKNGNRLNKLTSTRK